MKISILAMAKATVLGLPVLALAGCEVFPGQKSIVDRGIDNTFLEDGRANIWIDPDGCQHWWIDDGIEGYMSPRLNRDGTPRCQDERGAVTLKDGTIVVADPEPRKPV